MCNHPIEMMLDSQFLSKFNSVAIIPFPILNQAFEFEGESA
jgi:hypothetical protein